MKRTHLQPGTFAISKLRSLQSIRGQTLIEYVLIVVVVSIALIAALTVFGNGVMTTYSNAAASFPPSP